MPQPNIIAYLMLALWPLIAWQFWRRMDHGRALVWTVLGGYLVLPPLAYFDGPGLPDLNKVTIPNLTAFAFTWFVLKDRLSFLPENLAGKLLMALFVASPFATVLTNGDPIPIEAGDIPGARIYDSLAAVGNQAIVLLPYFLARRYLADVDAPKIAMAALVTGGLIYSLPILIESRLSPQINVWVYGFMQHDFSQTVRFGGYRPMVFLPHGLWLAFFAYMAAISAVRQVLDPPAAERPKQVFIALYLLAIVVVCKSAGPLVYCLATIPLILFAPPRVHLIVAGLLAAIVIAYPILRGAHLIPVDRITGLAAAIDADRAYSFAFRVNNEEQLLTRAAERPLFGWGGYGRNLLHDPVTGQTLTIADGAWIIVLGIYGWLGYVAEFGLLVLPLLLLAREALARHGARPTLALGTLALILAMNMVDLLPNGTEIPFTWLMAGALLGQAERMAAERRATATAARRAHLHPQRPKRTVI